MNKFFNKWLDSFDRNPAGALFDCVMYIGVGLIGLSIALMLWPLTILLIIIYFVAKKINNDRKKELDKE